jgi:hypothetical protein
MPKNATRSSGSLRSTNHATQLLAQCPIYAAVIHLINAIRKVAVPKQNTLPSDGNDLLVGEFTLGLMKCWWQSRPPLRHMRIRNQANTYRFPMIHNFLD